MSSPTTAPMPSPSRGVLAELLGRQAGKSHGKGRSMHIFTPSSFGGNGIVGAQVPVGAGAASAQMYRGEKTCAFAMYGNGASNQGQIFEAYDMPELWNLPYIFVSNTSYYVRGDMIPGLQANGTDIIAANQTVQYTRNWAVYQANGPLILDPEDEVHPGSYPWLAKVPGRVGCASGQELEVRSSSSFDLWSVTIDGWRSGINLDKEANTVVVETAKSLPEPVVKDLCGDISCNGTEPEMMTGREREEFRRY
ncbi:thiamine diphosphate-binding protein [Coprinopsis sp. MPI-PUGE-AT-0042]|nr:thiamine diphosphate-binding protein [Coprinopsis sp. MPI-PUGE-AT-0042]